MVRAYYLRWMDKFPTIHHLAAADLEVSLYLVCLSTTPFNYCTSQQRLRNMLWSAFYMFMGPPYMEQDFVWAILSRDIPMFSF